MAARPHFYIQRVDRGTHPRRPTLMALSRFAFLGRRWIVFASYPYAAIMTGNGLGHIAGSLYTWEFMPGVYSSPLLLAASIYLWWTARRTHALTSRTAAA